MKHKFKVLVDEVCAGLIPYLTALGWTVSPSVPKGNPDEQVSKAAKQRRAVIITKDRGLASKCHNNGIPCVLLEFPILREALLVDKQLKDMVSILDFFGDNGSDELGDKTT